jgi:hypothetical protein
MVATEQQPDYAAQRARVHVVCELLEDLLDEELDPRQEAALRRAYTFIVMVCEDLAGLAEEAEKPTA